eukprot:g26038.t2
MLGTTEFECTEMGFRSQYLKAVEELLDLGPVAWVRCHVSDEQLEPGEQLVAKTASKLCFNLASSGKSSLCRKISASECHSVTVRQWRSGAFVGGPERLEKLLAKLAKARAFVPNKLGDETKSFSSHGAESTDVTSSSDVTGDQVDALRSLDPHDAKTVAKQLCYRIPESKDSLYFILRGLGLPVTGEHGGVYSVHPDRLLFYSPTSEEGQDSDIQSMRSEEEVVQEFGSWHDYLELQRPSSYDEPFHFCFGCGQRGFALQNCDCWVCGQSFPYRCFQYLHGLFDQIQWLCPGLFGPVSRHGLRVPHDGKLMVIKAESPSLDALCGKPAEKRGVQRPTSAVKGGPPAPPAPEPREEIEPIRSVPSSRPQSAQRCSSGYPSTSLPKLLALPGHAGQWRRIQTPSCTSMLGNKHLCHRRPCIQLAQLVEHLGWM